MLKYGVSKVDIFQTNDLSEKKDIANVVNTIWALGRVVSHTTVPYVCNEFIFQLHEKIELDQNVTIHWFFVQV